MSYCRNAPWRIARRPGRMLDSDSRVGGVPFAGRRLVHIDIDKDRTYLRGLPNLLTDDLPLVRLVLLDGVQERSALLLSQRRRYQHAGVGEGGYGHLPHPRQTPHNACPSKENVSWRPYKIGPGTEQCKRENKPCTNAS
jgi:hypothetical protein